VRKVEDATKVIDRGRLERELERSKGERTKPTSPDGMLHVGDVTKPFDGVLLSKTPSVEKRDVARIAKPAPAVEPRPAPPRPAPPAPIASAPELVREPPPPPPKRVEESPPPTLVAEPPPPPNLVVAAPSPSPLFDVPVPSAEISTSLRPSRRAPIVVGMVAVAAAIAGAAFTYVRMREPIAAQPAAAIAQTTSAPEPDAVVAIALDAAVAAEPEPEPEIEVLPPETSVEAPPAAKPPTPRRSKAAVVAASGAASGSDADGPRTGEAAVPTPPDADPDCDEVGCVMEKYARPCCARFKPAAEAAKPDAGTSDALERAEIRAGVERMLPRVIACGEQFAVKGTVKVSITVDDDGNVQELAIQSSPDDALGECVASVLRRARFGKLVAGSSFTYPFVF
jgi:outer membrane biosynthesis protein TonB